MTVHYLVQHGLAKSKEEDPDRPLTGEGREEVRKIATMAKKLELDVAEIHHSGKTRAEETAVIFGRTLDLMGQIKTRDGLSPTDSVEPVAEDLENRERPIMVVGHLPFLPRLAGRLVNSDRETSPVSFRNGGIVCLEKGDEGWTVTWQLNPG